MRSRPIDTQPPSTGLIAANVANKSSAKLKQPTGARVAVRTQVQTATSMPAEAAPVFTLAAVANFPLRIFLEPQSQPVTEARARRIVEGDQR
jgi:hypothetical protein